MNTDEHSPASPGSNSKRPRINADERGSRRESGLQDLDPRLSAFICGNQAVLAWWAKLVWDGPVALTRFGAGPQISACRGSFASLAKHARREGPAHCGDAEHESRRFRHRGR